MFARAIGTVYSPLKRLPASAGNFDERASARWIDTICSDGVCSGASWQISDSFTNLTKNRKAAAAAYVHRHHNYVTDIGAAWEQENVPRSISKADDNCDFREPRNGSSNIPNRDRKISARLRPALKARHDSLAAPIVDRRWGATGINYRCHPYRTPCWVLYCWFWNVTTAQP